MEEKGFMKRHVLIVDDNKIDTLKVSAILEKEGIVAIIANDASIGLELSQRYRIDLAIIDIQMPQMNGFQLTREFKARPGTKNTPILIMSGSHKEQSDVAAALKSGANDFILKPIDSMILIAKVDALLKKVVPWGEWKIPDTNPLKKGYVQTEIEVTSISEMGLRIHSNVPLQAQSFPKLDIPLLTDIGIGQPYLRVLDCIKANEGYSIYLSFVGLPEPHLKELRILCKKFSAQVAEGK